MKKIAVIFFCLLALVVTCYAEAGEQWLGSKQNIKHTWYTGWDMCGNYMVSSAEGYGNRKKVYARMGETGTYSKWVDADKLYISVKDCGKYGSIGEGNYEHSCEIE